MHRVSSKFETVAAIRHTLINEFESHVPNQTLMILTLGILKDKQKYGLLLVMISTQCTLSMTKVVKLLYGVMEGCLRVIVKHDEGGVGRQQENEVDEVYKELKTKHGDKYEISKLRLWSRMICSDLHDDYESPLQQSLWKRSLVKILFLSQLLVLQWHAFQSNSLSLHSFESHGNATQHMSPGKMVEVRLKNLEQLKIIQQLLIFRTKGHHSVNIEKAELIVRLQYVPCTALPCYSTYTF